MKRLTALYITFFVAASFVDGAVVSPEFDFSDLPSLKNLVPLDLNHEEIAEALRADHPHAHLNATEVIRLYNYTTESHDVTTSDGYILEVHRITGNSTNPSPNGKPVVFLMHGLLCSSMDWVLAGPERGFAFILADAGYDVWMGNARGNKYSRKHVKFTVNDPEYWGFSWHEIGTSDLPTMIDYALAHTQEEKLYYVGHSQGSTTFFVMMTERPEYNDKVRAMFSLAPVAYCHNMKSPIFQFFSKLITPINHVTKYIGQYEFKPSSVFFNKFKSLLCTNSHISEEICMNAMFLFMGFNKDQFDITLLPAILAHIPAGSAVDQFVHYAQIINAGEFQKFSYGWYGNWKKYRRFTPPSYNLENVKVPVALHYSVNDWLSDPSDVEKLVSKLPNPIGKFRVPHDKFNHIDYLWGLDVKTLLYDKVMNLMERYYD